MEKIKKKVAKLLTISNNSNGDSNSKLRPPKLISFLLFIRQANLNNLGDQNDTEDKI